MRPVYYARKSSAIMQAVKDMARDLAGLGTLENVQVRPQRVGAAAADGWPCGRVSPLFWLLLLLLLFWIQCTGVVGTELFTAG